MTEKQIHIASDMLKLRDIKPISVECLSRCDYIKDNWWFWFCRAKMSNGRIIEGRVQADRYGMGADLYTFEPVEES